MGTALLEIIWRSFLPIRGGNISVKVYKRQCFDKYRKDILKHEMAWEYPSFIMQPNLTFSVPILMSAYAGSAMQKSGACSRGLLFRRLNICKHYD